MIILFFFFQAEDGIRDDLVTGVQTCALPIFNGAIDMAEEDRGNLRCFEAMGCGALMISDRGRYPKGMEDGVTMVTYGEARDAVAAIEAGLNAPARMREIAAKGLELMQIEYSKEHQWAQFARLIEGL